ncbi:MAG: sulfatase [Balneolales bacterium]
MKTKYLVFSLFLTIGIYGCSAVGPSEEPLNVIVINVDDLGWADLSVQGSSYYETPHIDGLASSGIRFTNAYAAASICSPTRASLLTGRYPARIGITDWIRSGFQGGEVPEDRENPTEYVGGTDKMLLTPPNPLWMERDEVTIAEILKEAGYTSAHIGKWHLGADAWYPEKQGFDLNIGGSDFGQPPSYFDPYYKENQGHIPTLEPRKKGEYLTDREADEALQFIQEHQDQPFFLHLAHYAVHTPIQAKEEIVERFGRKAKTNQKDPVYAAMVYSVDQAVGSILHKLRELNIDDRTLIIFTSDNGGLKSPEEGDQFTDNSPLRSGKGYPYEGGIRVPLIISWPGVVGPATISYEPVSSIDITPTIAEAVGANLPEDRNIDGRSLVDHLISGGREAIERNALLWHFPHYRVGHTIPPYSIVRSGDWKLIKWWEGPSYELYNLHEDIGEKNNLANEMSDKVIEMKTVLSDMLKKTNAKLPRTNPDFKK